MLAVAAVRTAHTMEHGYPILCLLLVGGDLLSFSAGKHTPRARSISWLVCRGWVAAFCLLKGLLPLNPHSPSEHWLSRTSFHRLDGLLQGMMPAKERATMHRHSRHQPATTNNTTTTTLAAAAAAPATYDSSDYLQPTASHSHRSTTTTNRHRDACGSSRPRRGLRSGSSRRSSARPTAWQPPQQESRKVLAWH